MPLYMYYCPDCGGTQELVVPYAGRPDGLGCADCGGIAYYRIGAPAVMQVAFPDGTRRPGWSELREANKLSRESAQTKSQESRSRIAQEIRRLGVRVGRGVV